MEKAEKDLEILPEPWAGFSEEWDRLFRYWDLLSFPLPSVRPAWDPDPLPAGVLRYSYAFRMAYTKILDSVWKRALESKVNSEEMEHQVLVAVMARHPRLLRERRRHGTPT